MGQSLLGSMHSAGYHMSANISLEEAKVTVSRANDWEELNAFLSLSEQLEFTNRAEFVKWVFQSLKGYIVTRKEAGLRFMHEQPDEGWIIISELIESIDPDDRDTASEVIRELQDPKGDDFVKQLLDDRWPYIQLDACEYLFSRFPEDVRPVLQKLSKHDREWVREYAKKMLDKNQG